MIQLERHTLISPLLATLAQPMLCVAKRASATPFVCRSYALFHFPYPVSLSLATLTKTTAVYPNNSHFEIHSSSSSQGRRPFLSCTYELPISQAFCFDIHASDGGCRGCTSVLSSSLELPISKLCLFTLFRTVLQSPKTQVSCFLAIPHCFTKAPVVGYPFLSGSALRMVGVTGLRSPQVAFHHSIR